MTKGSLEELSSRPGKARGEISSARLEGKLGFDRIRSMIEARCSTDYAASRSQTESFSAGKDEIRRRLNLTDEMRLILMFEEGFPTSGYVDSIPFLEAIQKNASIDLLSMGKLRTTLDTLDKAQTFFKSVKDGVYPNLKRKAARTATFPEVRAQIDTILDKYGEIKDTASDELYNIRKQLKEKELGLSKRMNAILRKAREDGLADADASVNIRDGRMLIPVSSAKKKLLPGIIHDESASGKTTFIEPAEIVALTGELSELRFAETREISRILREFSDFLRPFTPELISAAEFIGELDFIMAKAYVALDLVAGMPVISEEGRLSLRKARHPILERNLRKEHKQIVPLTINLTPQKHILMISGPNAGGKSVCLKTVGLLQYMFQWGMLIPTSETSELPVFSRIMVSIGDDQSIDNDLSTYSSFLADMKSALDKADEDTLVLIDEFGSGTEPAAGGAIAESILAELDRRGTYGVITTHYTNLKLYASSGNNGVANGAMLFDAQNMAPLFRLEEGLPGNSFAFELARKMGLPEEIVKDAEEKAGQEFVGIERNLRKIVRSRKALDEKLTRIRATDKTLESITDKYEKELQDIKETRRRIIDEAKEEAQRIVKDANAQVENTIRTIKESGADKEATKDARGQLQGFLGALEESRRERDKYLDDKLKTVRQRKDKATERKLRRADPEELKRMQEAQAEQARIEAFRKAPLKVGEKVRVKSNGMMGEVAKVSAKAITVIIGNVSTKMAPDRVERVTSNEYREAQRKAPKPRQVVDASIAKRRAEFRTELDVRGQRVTEALDNVVRYVDDALMLDVESVRILHGKGTGALREEIQKFVRTIPGVVSVQDEHIQLGGSGVSVVKFR